MIIYCQPENPQQPILLWLTTRLSLTSRYPTVALSSILGQARPNEPLVWTCTTEKEHKNANLFSRTLEMVTVHQDDKSIKQQARTIGTGSHYYIVKQRTLDS